MIHDGSDAMECDTKSFEAWGKQSERTRNDMYRIYLERMKAVNPKVTLKRVEDMCSHDRIFGPEQAVEIGLADWVMDTFEDVGYQADGGKKYTPQATTKKKTTKKKTRRK